jgi:hypothetical protein
MLDKQCRDPRPSDMVVSSQCRAAAASSKPSEGHCSVQWPDVDVLYVDLQRSEFGIARRSSWRLANVPVSSLGCWAWPVSFSACRGDRMNMSKKKRENHLQKGPLQ